MVCCHICNLFLIKYVHVQIGNMEHKQKIINVALDFNLKQMTSGNLNGT